VRRNSLPGSNGVRHGQDQAHLPPQPFREGDALELRGPQLGLEVPETALDLHMHHRVSAGEDHVSSSPVRRSRDWNLKADSPRGVGRGPDHLGQAQLAGIPKPDPLCRVQAY
jgi:hypothetical protein